MPNPVTPKKEMSKIARKRKRLFALIVLISLLICACFIPLLWITVIIIGGFIVYEAYCSDHIFYNPHQDYVYNLASEQITAHIVDNKLQFNAVISAKSTVLLEISLKASLLGWLFDPYLKINDDQQYFEKRAKGKRYVNLTGQDLHNLEITGVFCSFIPQVVVHVFSNIDLCDQKIMIIAPHADDAEIAACGLYSTNANNSSIITLSQGETGHTYFNVLGDKSSQLKGQIRSFDSISVPLWGGIKQQNCVQLGYFDGRLNDMRNNPSQSFCSFSAQINDIREARKFNALKLPADEDGVCTWTNLVADLVVVLEHFQPQIIVTPHLNFDSHPDHIAATHAVQDALQLAHIKVDYFLLYSNHLHQHDLLPLGAQGYGVPLPPAFNVRHSEHILCINLDAQTQSNKKISLSLMHDLQHPLSIKKIMRRILQSIFSNRKWQKLNEDEFFRKAVRRHEIFWVQTKL